MCLDMMRPVFLACSGGQDSNKSYLLPISGPWQKIYDFLFVPLKGWPPTAKPKTLRSSKIPIIIPKVGIVLCCTKAVAERTLAVTPYAYQPIKLTYLAEKLGLFAPYKVLCSMWFRRYNTLTNFRVHICYQGRSNL